MTREELTRALEYTEKKHRHDTVNTFDTDISMLCADVLRVLKNCIEIPNNATNGDVIMALFPTIDTYFTNVIDMKLWWNAKYKGTGEIPCNHADTEIAKSFTKDVEAVKELLPQDESEGKE